MHLQDLFKNEKELTIYVDNVGIYQGTKYMELLRALSFIYMDDFVAEIVNCEIKVYNGEFVWNNNKHNIKVVER